MMQDVDLRLDSSGHGRLTIGGVAAEGVAGVTVQSKAGQRTEFEVAFVVGEFAFAGQAEVSLAERSRFALIQLGWTPPAADAE